MHRVIKEYLQEKVSVSDGINFEMKFRKHFETIFLTYAIKQKIDDTEEYTLSLEEPNLYYLRELLLSKVCSLPEELSVLLFLFDRRLIQLEQLHGYYARYIQLVHEVCPLINSRLCGQAYTDIVTYLYQQCKCETSIAYFQNFFYSRCLEYFHCEVVSYLLSLNASKVLLQLSGDITSYIHLVERSHCRHVMHYNREKFFTAKLIFVVIITVLNYFLSPNDPRPMVMCALTLYDFGPLPFGIDAINSSAPYVRVMEVVLKFLCHFVIYFALMC